MSSETTNQTNGVHSNGVHVNGHVNGASTLPPFPDDVPTAPLLRLSLAKLQSNDSEEVGRLVRACEDLGFFYLDLQQSDIGDSILADADQLFKVGVELYDLPLEEKKKYDFMHKGSYFGYKGFGANVVDRTGRTDRNEFYNVRTKLLEPHVSFLATWEAICQWYACLKFYTMLTSWLLRSLKTT